MMSASHLLSSVLLAGSNNNITVTPWCDNSFRIQITPQILPNEVLATRQTLEATLKGQGLDELPGALIKGCGEEGASYDHISQRMTSGQTVRNGNLKIEVLNDGHLAFSTADDDKLLFSTVSTFAHAPTPAAVEYSASGAAVPMTSESDYILSEAASFAESKVAGMTDLRSGDPHAAGSAVVTHPINSNGHLLSGVSISFRYVAGYAGGANATTVSVSLVDALNGTLVSQLWTSPPLANYSYDHYTGCAPVRRAPEAACGTPSTFKLL
jgi:hypothetical protein